MTTSSRTLARLCGATIVAAGSVGSVGMATASASPVAGPPAHLTLTVDAPNQVAGRDVPVTISLGRAPRGLSEVTVADLVPADLSEVVGSARIQGNGATAIRAPRQVATTGGTLLVWRGVRLGAVDETLTFTLAPRPAGGSVAGHSWTDRAWAVRDRGSVPAAAPWPTAPSAGSTLGGETFPAVTVEPDAASVAAGAPGTGVATTTTTPAADAAPAAAAVTAPAPTVVAVTAVPAPAPGSTGPTPGAVLHDLGPRLVSSALAVPVVEVAAVETADPAVHVTAGDVRAERLTITTSPTAGTSEVTASLYLPTGLTWVRCAEPGTCDDPTVRQVRMPVGRDGLPVLPAPVHPGRARRADFTQVSWDLKSVPADSTLRVAYLLRAAPGPASYTDLAVASSTPVPTSAGSPSDSASAASATGGASAGASASDVTSQHVFAMALQAGSGSSAAGSATTGVAGSGASGILPASASQPAASSVDQIGASTPPAPQTGSGSSAGTDPFVPGAATPTAATPPATAAVTPTTTPTKTAATTPAKAAAASAPLAYTGFDVRAALGLAGGLIGAGGIVLLAAGRTGRIRARQALRPVAPSGE